VLEAMFLLKFAGKKLRLTDILTSIVLCTLFSWNLSDVTCLTFSLLIYSSALSSNLDNNLLFRTCLGRTRAFPRSVVGF